MADAIISAVPVRVTAIIEDQIRYQVNLVRGVEKEILNLSNKLVTIKTVLDDAEKRGVKEQGVKNWLRKLEDVAYQMDDVLDEWNYALPKHKPENPPNRKVIKLISFSELPSLPPMGKLPLLEVLYLQQVTEMKLVGREFLGLESPSSSSANVVAAVAFPKLKELTFFFCPELSEWEDITVEEEESPVISVMPCLVRLRFYSCAGLKKLPHRLLRKASLLQILNIFYSPELQRTYMDEDGSPWRSISSNNPQLRLYY